MKNVLIVVLTLAVAAALAIFFLKINDNAQKFQIMRIGNSALKVVIADTAEKREQGLSGRVKLEENEGMLFIFDKAGIYYFWMKGMRFPLDFIYLNNNEVVEIKDSVSQFNLIPFAPSQPFDAVLEVNAGFVQRNAVRVGEPATY